MGNHQSVANVRNMAIGAVELIPVPSGLLARRLRGKLWCQKRAGIGHAGH
jgi:hypothetical protein